MQRQNLLLAALVGILSSGCCLHHRPEIFKPPGLRRNASQNPYTSIYQPAPLYPMDQQSRLTSLSRKQRRELQQLYSQQATNLYGQPAYAQPTFVQPAAFQTPYSQSFMVTSDCGCGAPAAAVMPTIMGDDCGCGETISDPCQECGPASGFPVMQMTTPVMNQLPQPVIQQFYQPAPAMPSPVMHTPIMHEPVMPVPMPPATLMPAHPIPMPSYDASCTTSPIMADPSCHAPVFQNSFEPGCAVGQDVWYDNTTSAEVPPSASSPVPDQTLNPPVPPEKQFRAPGTTAEEPVSDEGRTFDDMPEQTNPDFGVPEPSTPAPRLNEEPDLFPGGDINPASWQTIPNQSNHTQIPGHRIVTRQIRGPIQP
ncbi:MAG: hypothetical protein KDA91_06345 [Planctomycetaceae bacterium]|nr:hypothetical protein [Planctomycetaceae bacterium]